MKKILFFIIVSSFLFAGETTVISGYIDPDHTSISGQYYAGSEQETTEIDLDMYFDAALDGCVQNPIRPVNIKVKAPNNSVIFSKNYNMPIPIRTHLYASEFINVPTTGYYTVIGSFSPQPGDCEHIYYSINVVNNR